MAGYGALILNLVPQRAKRQGIATSSRKMWIRGVSFKAHPNHLMVLTDSPGCCSVVRPFPDVMRRDFGAPGTIPAKPRSCAPGEAAMLVSGGTVGVLLRVGIVVVLAAGVVLPVLLWR